MALASAIATYMINCIERKVLCALLQHLKTYLSFTRPSSQIVTWRQCGPQVYIVYQNVAAHV